MKHSAFSRLLAIGLLGFFAATASAEANLVGHPALGGQTLDTDAAKAVLLGKRVTVGDVRVSVVIAKSSAAQDQFLQATVGMNTSQFQNHWRRLFMTGNGSAPKIVDDEAAAAKAVAETTGAVAIVDSSAAGSLAVLAK